MISSCFWPLPPPSTVPEPRTSHPALNNAHSIPFTSFGTSNTPRSWLRRVVSSILILASVLSTVFVVERALSRAKNRAATVDIYAKNLGRQMQVRRLLAQFLIVAYPVVVFLLVSVFFCIEVRP